MNFGKKWHLSCFLAATLLTTNVTQAAGLLTGLVHEARELQEVLIARGFTSEQATSLLASKSEALRALVPGGGENRSSEIFAAIRELPVEGASDQRLKESLMVLLKKDSKNISKADLENAFNGLIYLSHRYGRGAATTLACGQCVDISLAEGGIRYTLEAVSDTNAKKLLLQIPTRPSDLKRYLQNKMNAQNLGDFSRVTSSQLAREEERSLALFLAMKESPSEAQRSLYEAIVALSKDSESGKTNIFDRSNPHKLWKIFAEDPSEEEVVGWSKLLGKVAQERQSGESLESAFFRELESRAGSDPSLLSKLNELKERNCYFK